MPELTKDALREQVRRREFAAAYVLHGSETFLRDIAGQTISNLAFGEGDLRDFNEDEFSLNIPESLTTALASAQQLPMMAARRVIRIRDVKIAATSNRDTLKEDHAEVLESYLKDPSPSSVLVFIADEFNKNRKTSRILSKYASVVEFQPLEARQVAEWAMSKIKDADARISDADLQHLLSLVGNDLRRLSTEIEKLATAALPEKVITADMIDDLVPFTREITNFDLTEHLVAGRNKQAMTVLKKILDDGAEPLALLGLISYNFRRLLIAKEMMANGAPRDEVARAVKLRYRDQEPFLAAARRADRSVLIRTLSRLNETDVAIKTSLGGGGPAGSRMQIEMLVCETAMSG